jgi:hypothetical protein
MKPFVFNSLCEPRQSAVTLCGYEYFSLTDMPSISIGGRCERAATSNLRKLDTKTVARIYGQRLKKIEGFFIVDGGRCCDKAGLNALTESCTTIHTPPIPAPTKFSSEQVINRKTIINRRV